MKKLTRKQLLERWYTDEGIERRNLIMRCLEKNIPLENLDFIEKIDSYYDLRGITFDLKMNLKNITLKDIDFSYCDLSELILTNCNIQNVIFYMSNCYQFTQFKCMFENCKFIKCKLNVSGFGIKGGQYNNILFKECKFNSAGFYYPDFNDCVFDNCNLTRVDFGGSHLKNVKFIGRLDDVWFRGLKPTSSYEIEGMDNIDRSKKINPMIVDLSEAYLWYITYSDYCDLSNVVLSKDGKHFLLKNVTNAIKYLRNELENENNECIKKTLNAFLAIMKAHKDTQDMKIINSDQILYMAEKRMGQDANIYCKKILNVLKSM